MKLISVILVIVFLTGCTTFRPVEMSSIQLQEQFADGNIIKPGDRVKIVTTDGEKHVFRVTSIMDDRILGKTIEIPIVDIISIEKEEKSTTGTIVVVSVAAILLIMALSSYAGNFGNRLSK